MLNLNVDYYCKKVIKIISLNFHMQLFREIYICSIWDCIELSVWKFMIV